MEFRVIFTNETTVFIKLNSLCEFIINKEARRLYTELKSLAHLISDEIMMSLYGISEIMMS